VKVSGEANQMLANKEQVMQQAKAMEVSEMQGGSTRPKEIVSLTNYDYRQLNYDKTVAAFTKIMWLQDPIAGCRAVLMDATCREYMIRFAESRMSPLSLSHLKFYDEGMKIRMAQGADQIKLIRKAHMKKYHNDMFYCVDTEITYGTIMQQNWGPIFERICGWMEQSVFFLASDTFQRFLEDEKSTEMISKLRVREMSGEQLFCRTVSAGLNPASENYWLDMFRVMSESASVGMVVSDMTVPGIPLAHINEGFRAVTGYGKEKIGTSCRFLQGPGTQDYLNDEILEALRNQESLITKLTNYKANGQTFQCLFALHPVFGPQKEYKYQIGVQIDFNMNQDITRQLLEMERVLRFMPHSVGGDDSEDVLKLIPTSLTGDSNVYPWAPIDPSAVGGAAAAPAGGMGMGMGMGGGMGMGMGMGSPGGMMRGSGPRKPE